MESFLLQFKHSYLIVPICIVIGIILFYIDSKITSTKRTTREYVKLSFIVGIISSLIVYIDTIKGTIEEEILSGPAPF